VSAGRIALSLAERNGTVALLVDDDGPGIPEADRGRVLERFVRLDDARARDAGGSGLGLAMVAELVAAHGGTVRIANGALGGARVELRLPGADEPGDCRPTRSPQLAEQPFSDVQGPFRGDPVILMACKGDSGERHLCSVGPGGSPVAC
jgi:Histidine kinase-, DNA gyrase B-, and HSP90-like ATPase